MKKKIVTIVAAFAVVTLTGMLTVFTAACDLTDAQKTEIKAAAKAALVQAGTVAYSEGKVKFDAWLTQQVSSGKITEEQKAAALALYDKGGPAALAVIESGTSGTSGTGTGTNAATAADTSGAVVK